MNESREDGLIFIEARGDAPTPMEPKTFDPVPQKVNKPKRQLFNR